MNWLERLNTAARAPGGSVEIYAWNYAAHLSDNVAHRHTFYEICLVGAWGEGTFTVEGAPHPIQSGDLFIARPGVIHQIRNRAPRLMELFWVSFGWSEPSENAKAPQTDETHALYHALADSALLIARDDGLILELWQALRAVAGSAEEERLKHKGLGLKRCGAKLLSFFAKSSGRASGVAFEGFGEVMNVGETAQRGDVRQRPIAALQQFCGVTHPHFEQIFARRNPINLAKNHLKARDR